MTQGLQEIGNHELTVATERILLPKLADLIRSKDKGHCMKISDLDLDLMIRLCGSLQAEVNDAQVVILGDGENGRVPAEMVVSSTKLVELRNPQANNSLRPPLLVFVPSNLKASAEDSFGVATFEEVNIGDIYQEVKIQEIQKIPASLRHPIQEVLSDLEQENWQYADSLAIVRFLLTVQVNDCDPSVVGATLFELGLVPDFELLTEPHKALQRVKRNRECVQKLTWSTKSERMRVFELGLADKSFRTKLANFLVEAGLEDPKAWTRKIVVDRSYWDLAFHRWQFEDGGEEPSHIYLRITDVKLPTIPENETDERLISFVGQRILTVGKKGLRSFSVEFQIEPPPTRISNLAKFTAQVISVDQGPVGLVSSKSAWKTSKPGASINFSKLNKISWEEGWHYVRILAYTDTGDLIPLVDEHGTPLPWSLDSDGQVGTLPNESDLFYVLQDETLNIEPIQRSTQKEASLIHAQLRLQFTALLGAQDHRSITPSSVNWSNDSNRYQDAIRVTFGREGKINIPVSPQLKAIEQKILSDPRGALRWRLPIGLMGAGDTTQDAQAWTQDDFTNSFLEARTNYFMAVQAGTKRLVSQAVDFHELKPLVVEYASRYLKALRYYLQQAEDTGGNKQSALNCLRTLLSVDTISINVTNHRGVTREAALISPTHPLRALWFTVWTEVGRKWLEAAAQNPEEYAIPTREALLKLLAPLNFPPVLSTGSSHLLTAIDNLHPYWTLYSPTEDSDPRGLIGNICAALGLEEPGIGGSLIDGSYLATRVQRYLIQHPYIRTLTINAFNPGRATVLADMLLELQKNEAFSDLNYDIRLFVPDADTPGIGSALLNLLSSSNSVAVKEADAFSTPSNNHLYPKLSLAIYRKEDFSQQIDHYSAHLSILFDIFPAQQIGADLPPHAEANAPVYGLFQDFWTAYREDSETVQWRRQPKHGQALPIQENEPLSWLISELPVLMSSAIAAIATNQTAQRLLPVITLSLDTKERALIHQVHEASDWVITLDRNMGIEFFDHGGLKNRPDYLIDHSPGMVSKLGHRLVITSRSMAELEAMVSPLLKQYGLPTHVQYASVILEQLRSLSGRLALKLISSPTQQAEVLGLALARLYLTYQGVFSNQIVIPLDAHLELYRVLQRQADELGDEVSFKRTDLALFDLDAATKTITCRLVEVKCYTQIGGAAQFSSLKESIVQQISQSERVLAHHFDPQCNPVDRPDRLIKTRELAALLEFYLDRGVRYGLIEAEVEAEARFLLGTIDNGHHLTFTRSAIVFDFEKSGTDPIEEECNIEYHRIGIDLIRQLLDASVIEPNESEGLDEGVTTSSTKEIITTSTAKLRQKVTSIPVLETAAFLGKVRDRDARPDPSNSYSTFNTQNLAEQISQIPEENIIKIQEVSTVKPDELEQIQIKPKLESEPVSSLSKPISETLSSQTQDEAVEQSCQEQTSVTDQAEYDILLGASTASPQYGILGEISGRKVAVDLNQTHTISLFGVQGGGKSYTLGTIVEMASLPIPAINNLPQPLTTVIFHYSPTQDYKPEFTSMVKANSDERQIEILRERYGAQPKALSDVVLLAPADKIAIRQAEFPDVKVYPLKFASSELKASHWRFLMGAVGNQSAYIRQLNRIMKTHRDNLTLEVIRRGIDDSLLPDQLKGMAHQRLDLASDYIDDSSKITDLICPGRLFIIDLRDDFIEKDEALGLFVVLLQLFADTKVDNKSFNKLVVFDEAHKYIDSPDLLAGLIEVVREMRHKGTSIMVASQDPPSVPTSLIELSDLIVLHKFNSPSWLKHIQRANTSLNELNPERMSQLQSGEAYVWANRSTDSTFTRSAVKVHCRPRVTQHGGATMTATGNGS